MENRRSFSFPPRAMKVTKMHGIGNDYVYVDGFVETVDDAPALARRLADRHFGVGGDGLIVIARPGGADADCRMEMYNADGSRAQMCGNGIRCVAKFARDHGIVETDTVRVETDAGLRIVELVGTNGAGETLARVRMGRPDLAQASLPARVPGAPEDRVVESPLEVPGIGRVRVTLVSTGNPHCVVRIDDERQPATLRQPLADLDLASIGPHFERHDAFPERTNTEFIDVIGRGEIGFRVWERGSGETLACGTGACAAVVAGVVAGFLDRRVIVHLRGGDLDIRWDDGDEVLMTGPAVEVFTADVDPAWLAGAGR